MKYGNIPVLLKSAVAYPAITRSMVYRQALKWFYSQQWLHRGHVRTRPAELVMLISRKCFLNCIMCGTKAMYGNDERFTDFMDVKHIKKIADEIAEWKTPVYVKLTGGEATMHPDFEEIIHYFGKKRIPVRLSTNGVRLAARSMAKAVVDANVEVVTISVDGLPQNHNAIRMPDVQTSNPYETVLKAVESISYYKKKTRSRYPMIQFTCTMNSMNYMALKEFVDELQGVDIQWLHLAVLQYITEENGRLSQVVAKGMGGEGDDKWRFFHDAPYKVMKMDMAQYEEQLKLIFSSRYSFPVSIGSIGGINRCALEKYHYSDDLIHKSICANPYLSAVILSPGYLCFCIDFPQFYYGDVREKSVEELWYSDKAQDFRSKFLQYYNVNGQNMPQCLRCGWRFW